MISLHHYHHQPHHIFYHYTIMSSNKNWTNMFKSKPSNNNHNHHHDIDALSCMHYSNCNISSSFSSESDCVPGPKPRWNPKPEQIEILESIFNSGIVNPHKEEIERIRIRLQEYGQISDANVFYWFQNRKSKAKHKLRNGHHKNPKIPKKDKMVMSSEDADHCFGSVNQKTGLFQVQNNELVVTEPAGYQFPFQNDQSTAQSLFGFGDLVVPAVTDETVVFTAVNNGLEIGENLDKTPTNYFYGGGNCSSLVPLTVPLTTNQSQDKERVVVLPGCEDAGDCVSPVRITVFVNDMPFEVVAGLFNVREAFGNESILINSFGQPILTDEFGVTLQPLLHGAVYYLI